MMNCFDCKTIMLFWENPKPLAPEIVSVHLAFH